MNDISNLIYELPKMKAGEELKSALEYIPHYDENIRMENDAMRLMELNELYNIYLPSEMSLEIYSKLYLAMLRSLQKKGTKLAIQQKNENFKAIQQSNYSGIIGGSDSFTIIGASGIGKSSAISRAISLITENRIIEVQNPYVKIIPCLISQCPFDCSAKGLLLEILRKVDELIGSKYYENALRARATTDMLIGNVSQVSLNHIGLLVVDEIQNICNNKSGNSLVAVLTQLINNSGISICMVGTPESSSFFEQAMQLARRSLGLHYSNMPYDNYFKEFCKTVFRFQYVKQRTELTDAVIEWLYEHSNGIISIVISLVHDAQEIAILNKKEILNIDTLNEAYKKRLNMLHDYLNPSIVINRQTSRHKKHKCLVEPCKIGILEADDKNSIVELAKIAKRQELDFLELLKERFSVTEVNV
ncbi:TniB family NTP-binding protein [Acetivibrio mesophilus]|uniref:AAA+ ATPase domain-containing protein n=1 Tax=Acetivibrio mesophilus TaxID=2487273 RepID=A0A4Q0I5W7_9FIRM|nr:TniB family NTP-binding protein [Acetivibrio mesophilus]RXE59638.1 hypothetical protein EFD62_06730 [Acetivibrio mesophilus]